MMTEPEMIAAFETVLRESVGLDPASCRESEHWWRFEVEGLSFQGGVHRADVRVMALLCKLSTDPDILDLRLALGGDATGVRDLVGTTPGRFVKSRADATL